MGDFIDIKITDGTFKGYLAKPAQTPAAVIVVIQEIFGINRVMTGIADDFAAQGYLAIAPDLFWRIKPGIVLDDQKPDDWKEAFAHYQAFDVAKGVADIGATIALARTLPGNTGKVGVVGYCLGGLLTFLSAARSEADAYVAYYGGGTDQHVDAEGPRIKKPLLMHLAEEDEYIGKDAQQKIRGALAGNPQVEIHTYPGRNHAFARKGGGHYDAADAWIADDRTATFFTRHLR